MKFFLAVLFFVACGVFLVWDTSRVVTSWLGPSLNMDIMYFKDSDPKLFLVWAVLLLSLASWFLWPSLWRAKPGHAVEVKWKQALSIGFAVSGLLALFKIVFSDGYLSTARTFGEDHGYVVCDETRYKYFGELRMVKNSDHCPK